MQQRFERLADMLAAADPPAAVELLLRVLVESNGATSGATLTAVGGRLIIHAVREANPELLARACAAWPACEPQLRAGRPLQGTEHVLLPLAHEGELVGALYLETGGPVDPAPQAAFLAALARAMSNAGWLVRAQPDERSMLRKVLEESEWNISRSARMLGVTRRTVYARMKRLGIPRRKRSNGRA